MTRSEIIEHLVNASDIEYEVVIQSVALCRQRIKQIDGAPKKPGPKPGSTRKPKVNGAPVCEKHGVPMTVYANGPACGKCAQEGTSA